MNAVTPPDSTTLQSHGPNLGEAALRVHSESVQTELAGQRRTWLDRGFTRRRFIAGSGMVGVAALSAQYVTTRVAFAAPGTATGHAVVFVFLRGGCDGLRLLAPGTAALGSDYLASKRGSLAMPATTPLVGGWGVNNAFAPLMPLWKANKLAFVPAVTSGDASRSHFQAQDYAECGGPPSVVRTGWLDRLLATMGPGTTFRAVAEGNNQPRSLAGDQPSLVLDGIDNFRFPGDKALAQKSKDAIAGLYRGLGHPLVANVTETLSALTQAEKIAAAPHTAGNYGVGGFGNALSDLARLIKADAGQTGTGKVGLEIATVDVGGFDTHTNEAADLDRVLGQVATALSGFYADLGPSADNVTVVTMTEFGRRVGSNGGGGTDHGHGAVMFLLGGGVNGGKVHGQWQGLSDAVLDNGDVPPTNQAFDVLGEVVQQRLGVGALTTVFPNHAYKKLGVMA